MAVVLLVVVCCMAVVLLIVVCCLALVVLMVVCYMVVLLLMVVVAYSESERIPGYVNSDQVPPIVSRFSSMVKLLLGQ